MPRPDSDSPWIDGRAELGARSARVGAVRFGLISLKGLGLIVVAVLGVAWFSEAERPDDARGQLLPGEPGGGHVSIAVSPDGRGIATTDFRGHLAAPWQTDDGWWSEKLIAHSGYANTTVFSPDGRFLAGGGAGLAVWELGLSGRNKITRRCRLQGVQALSAFSPDSKTPCRYL